MSEKVWSGGERNRPLEVKRPCECGCDGRQGEMPGVGYLTGSDKDGSGFTIWIKTENVYHALKRMIDARRMDK